MPPPWATNPAPKTESAREAAKSFFCDLCQKGYSRINEFEAHEGSYDHQHKKRLKDMTRLTRASNPNSNTTNKPSPGDPITIKPISLGGGGGGKGGGGGGFKKGGFKKNAFASSEEEVRTEVVSMARGEGEGEGEGVDKMEGVEETKMGGGGGVGGRGGRSEQEEWERWGDYDPKRPTGCGEGCRGRRGVVGEGR